MTGRVGNIYIADKRAHAIRKVKLDGTIVLVAGINISGSGPVGNPPRQQNRIEQRDSAMGGDRWESRAHVHRLSGFCPGPRLCPERDMRQ